MADTGKGAAMDYSAMGVGIGLSRNYIIRLIEQYGGGAACYDFTASDVWIGDWDKTTKTPIPNEYDAAGNKTVTHKRALRVNGTVYAGDVSVSGKMSVSKTAEFLTNVFIYGGLKCGSISTTSPIDCGPLRATSARFSNSAEFRNVVRLYKSIEAMDPDIDIGGPGSECADSFRDVYVRGIKRLRSLKFEDSGKSASIDYDSLAGVLRSDVPLLDALEPLRCHVRDRQLYISGHEPYMASGLVPVLFRRGKWKNRLTGENTPRQIMKGWRAHIESSSNSESEVIIIVSIGIDGSVSFCDRRTGKEMTAANLMSLELVTKASEESTGKWLGKWTVYNGKRISLFKTRVFSDKEGNVKAAATPRIFNMDFAIGFCDLSDYNPTKLTASLCASPLAGFRVSAIPVFNIDKKFKEYKAEIRI